MKKKRKIFRTGTKTVLHILQQAAIVTGVMLLLYVTLGSVLWVETDDGNTRRYQLHQEEYGTAYEDSGLFNEILGENITDIICFGAIRGQMEEDGQFYGKKEIDVTAFVNRYNGIPREYITAKYYLEDLLKWAQHGFDLKEEYLSGKEADDFLSRTRSLTSIDISSDQYNGDAATYLNSDFESVTRVQDVSGNILLSDDEPIRDDVNATLLTNLYQTIEHKNIEKYVSSWPEYYDLCQNIQAASNDLLINYGIYEKYGIRFNAKKTNIRYCIRKTVGDKIEVYSNLDLKDKSIAEIDKAFYDQCNKYIYYNPADMEFATNTLIKEETIRYVVKGYQYAYPENTQIWIGVDTKYPVTDIFTQGYNGFSNYVPYYVQLLVAAIACILLYSLLLIILTHATGRAEDEEGNQYIQLRGEDHIPTEIMLIMSVVAGVGIVFGTAYFGDRIFGNVFYTTWFLPVGGALVLLFSLVFSYFYYSFVRRIKAGRLWKDSLLRKIGYMVKRIALDAYDHGGILKRVWIPVIGVMALHVCLLYLLIYVRSRDWVIVINMIFIAIDISLGVLFYRSAKARETIVAGIKRIKEGDLKHKVEEKDLHGDTLVLAQAVNSIGDGISTAVETSMKDERMKADLITNVSHDIKTPLTSIINYIDLIKRENITNDKVKEYIEVLDSKSQRLKQLTDDLVEASKISSGNISLQWETINLVELVNQTIGEFSEKFDQRRLEVNVRATRNNLLIEADSRRIWRVIENLFNNIYKYAMENTRVYIDIREINNGSKQVVLSVKNISAQPLNISADELTERFIRGDVSRSTEGSGLGLSIAKSLTEAQNGSFEIVMDGDLFKVILTFPLLEQK